jgi:NAD(P)-dependent dehydrogenase (short-subunit alcohol dehydrogenase family)
MSERQGRVACKVAIVTGAGSTPGPGMATGRACAIVLARVGARVVLADVIGERAEETQALIEKEGGTATVFVGDMTKAADCDAMVRAAVDAYGTLDILVNNIGVAHAGNVVDTSEETWDRVLNLSLKTAFLASKSAVPVMAAKRSGAIVNIGSITGTRGGNYVAAASGLPGTNGDGWDVGWAAAFLASDEAHWITGAVLPVDGGVTAVTPLMMAPHLRAEQAPPE